MQIVADTIVSIHYRLTLEDGKEIDSSAGRDPLLYMHGHGQIIPGLETALDDKASGERFTVAIAPEEGYGAYDPDLDLRVPLEMFPEDQRGMLEPGARFEGPHPEEEGATLQYQVHKVEEDAVLCSGNHPLAGQTLHFEIEVVDVRAATPTELAHGHAHGEGGCAH